VVWICGTRGLMIGLFTGFWLECPKGSDYCEGLGLFGGIILGWTLRK